MYDYFDELAKFVAQSLGFPYDNDETAAVREFMMQRYNERN